MKRFVIIFALTLLAAAQNINAQSVACFNLNRVMNEYRYTIEASAAIKSQSDEVEAQISKKTNNLEIEISSFQQKLSAGIYTQSQAQAENARLQRKQADVESFAQQKRAEIQQKTNTLNNEILALIQDFVNRFNAGGRYSMIFANQMAGGVENYVMYLPLVSAPGAVDITNVIIEGLNAEYAAKKAN